MAFTLTQDGGAYNTVPFTFTFDQQDVDGPSAYLTINTADLATFDLDEYAMVLTATSTLSGEAAATRAFTLTLKSQCWDVTLTPPSFVSSTLTVDLFATQAIEFNEADDPTLSNACGDFSYKIYYESNDAEVDTAVYSVDASTQSAPLISATPTDRGAWIGSFTFYVVATYGSYNSVTATSSNELTVTIVEPCLSTTITDTVTFSTMTLSVLGGAVTQNFVKHKDAKSVLYPNGLPGEDICGPRAYSIAFTPALNPATTITTFAVIDATTMQLSVETDEATHEGTYSAVVTVGLANWSSDVTPVTETAFTVNVDACVPSIVVPSAPTPSAYKIYDTAYQFNVGAYSIDPACAYSFTISATWDDAGTVKQLPS